MIKRRISLLVFFLTISASLMAQTVYQQNFREVDPQLSEHDDMYTHEKIENHKFVITQKNIKYSYQAVEIPLEDGKDYSIETIVTHIAGGEMDPYGLVFAGEGATDNYIFAISANGRFIFGSQTNGLFTPIIRWTESNVVKRGNSQPNKLRIETAGDKLKLIINDRQVAKIAMIQPFGNEVGFVVGKPQTAAFEYLLVSYMADPSNETVNKPTKQPSVLPRADSVRRVVVAPAKAIDSPPNPDVAKIAPIAVSAPVLPESSGRDSIKKPVNAVTINERKPTAADSVKNTIAQPVNTVVVSPPAPTPAGTANAVVTIPVNPSIINPVISSASVPVDAQAARPVNSVVTAPAGASIIDTARSVHNTIPAVAAIDTAKKAVNQAVNSVVNQRLNAVITDTAFYADFNAGDKKKWVLNQSDSTSQVISTGTLRISHRAKFGFTDAIAICSPKVDMHRDFLINTTTVHFSGRRNYGYGIEFGADSAHQYHFWITASGYYNISKTDDKGFTTTISYNSSDFIKKGDSVKNMLGIEHKGGQLYFFVNGQQVEKHPDIDFSGHMFGVSVASSQFVGFDKFTFGFIDKPASAVASDTVSTPQITVTSPEVTRGLKVVQNSDMLHVVGKAKDKAGIISIKVNDVPASFDDNGNFMVDIPMAVGENVLKIVAQNAEMRLGFYTFHVTRNVIPAVEQAVVKQVASEGKYFALLIGEQDYLDQRIPSLEQPVIDANNLSNALVNNYTFAPENISILQNPSRKDFFKALEDMKSKVNSEDNVLIFYAGHGKYDDDQLQGYWFPSDAMIDRRDTWISNSDLIGYLRAIKSKHTLLISDACFSGSIFKGRGIEFASKGIQELYKLPSRKAMTSGMMKPVADKSIFIQYLVKRLNDNTDKFLSSEQLFFRFKEAVVNNSATGQIPQFGEIREAGDEGGDFIFIRKE